MPHPVQAWGDGVQVLAWPGTGLSVWAVYTGRSSCWTTASSFRQPPSTRCSTVSARYLRPSHLRCRWTNDMELVPTQLSWAGHANWLFSSYTEDVSFWSVLGTLSALEALLATMRYINWHWHLHLLRVGKNALNEYDQYASTSDTVDNKLLLFTKSHTPFHLWRFQWPWMSEVALTRAGCVVRSQ